MINTNKNLLLTATILALCIISFVHICLFPLYDINPKRNAIKAIVDFEQSLCETNLKHHRKFGTQSRHHHCPQDGIVTVIQGGRLGNQLWEYVSVWALARQTGLEPYMPRCIRQRLEEIFETLTVPTLDEIAHCSINLNTFVHSLDKWNDTSQSIVLYRYIILVEIVLTWVQDVREEFTFRREIREKADHILRTANKQQQHKFPVYVGVHVRRTDYSIYLWRKHRIGLVGSTYFYTAMDYFERKYQPVLFIVISDDPDWCVKHLTQKPNVYIVGKNRSPGQDLALMAACNHSIIDYGTYGFWGAILAGGETIVYNLTNHSTTRAAKILQNWHIFS